MDLAATSKARIHLRPLDMNDTGFMVWNKQDAGRIAEPQIDRDTCKRPPDAGVPDAAPPPFGGHGSTAPDYLRLAQMLLNGGDRPACASFSRKTVALMTSDHCRRACASARARSPVEESSPTPEFGRVSASAFACARRRGRNPGAGLGRRLYWSGVHAPISGSIRRSSS